MTDRSRPRIAITDEEGRPMAVAEVDAGDPSRARASLHVEPGHLPIGTRDRLVDAVLDDAEVRSCAQVQVAVPLGETEILDRLRDRCEVHGSHPAGVTCLMDVTPPGPGTST